MNPPDQFEQQLSRQVMRKLPAEWRGDILSAARATATAPTPARSPALSSGFLQRLSSVLWPHPAAWAGLAAVWLVVLGLSWSAKEPAAEPLAREGSPRSREWRDALQQRERI